MGRPLFNRFLTGRGSSPQRGVYWDDAFASWDVLSARGAERASLVKPQRAYVVDPTRALEALVSFFAVASVADTLLLWAKAAPELGPTRELAAGLLELDAPIGRRLDRPLWGILTSGTSGNPKVVVGHADALELVALHYDAAVFRPSFEPESSTAMLATCLPLQFSAAFFMAVLPALVLRRDLLIFPPHDWRRLCAAAQREPLICQSVPAVTAAGALSAPHAVDMSRVTLLLGGGYVTAGRAQTIRERFRGARLANIYGTAETGAISIDRAPGESTHVGHPIPGKPVWLLNQDEHGVGIVATTGPDCRAFYWTAATGLEPADAVVASTDYGRFDAGGQLYLEGRLDGGAKLHGITVYPRHVERHILGLEGVVDVRVSITQAANGREQLSAKVVGRALAEQVREHCTQLPEPERPSLIECISEQNSAGAYTAHGKL